MISPMEHSGERVVVEEYQSTASDYLIYLFHLATYRFAESFSAGRAVLDLGCGSGYGAALLAGEASSVVGVDTSREAIDRARAEHRAPGLRFETIEADRPLPFADQCFDTVLSFQVIEHVADPHFYLAEALRLLRPGGHLLLATPDRATRLLPFQRPWNPWHRTEYSERTLKRLLRAHCDQAEILHMSGRSDVLELELRRTRRFRLLMLPITLPVLPDRLRVTLLAGLRDFRRRNRRPRAGTTEHGFDESALWIRPGASPSVNLIAVARR